jgi:cobaltochelatase CobS
MKARFVTSCKTCKTPINIGDEITWARRGEHKGTHHAACYQPKTTVTATKAIETNEEAIETNEEAIETNEEAIETAGNSLEEMLAKRLEPFISVQTTELEEKLTRMIEESLANQPKQLKTVYIQQGRTLGTVTGTKHEHFDLLYKRVTAKNPVTGLAAFSIFLWGEAGSGKSSAAKAIADSLGWKFYYLGLQNQTVESRLMGYMDANGKYVASDFYRAYSEGGIFLFDELELANGNLLGSLNGALANGHASFPCGITKRHPDFVCIATGNTPGYGANVAYSDSKPLNNAVRDRFTYMQWDTDETLERELAAQFFEHSDPWVTWVRAVRAMAKVAHPKLTATQRASIDGALLLSLGEDVATVAESVVFRGFDRVTVSGILSQYPLPTF